MTPPQTAMLMNQGPVAAALIGVWNLRQYCEVTPGLPPKHPFGINPQGLLIYTADGFVSAILMAPNRPNLSGDGLADGTLAEYAAASRSFIGYSGVYEVDEAQSVVTHRPRVAFAPNMVGTSQRRLVALNGDVLVLTVDDVQPVAPGTPRSILEWVRVNAARLGKNQ